MRRKLTLALILAFGGGLAVGLYVRQNALQTAVIVANAKADAYALSAVETAKNCKAPGSWFRK